MSNNITVYNSYKNGLQTLKGSFPLYNPNIALTCNNVTTLNEANTSFSDLNEFVDLQYLVLGIETDLADPDPLNIISLDLDESTIDPSLTGIINYDNIIVI